MEIKQELGWVDSNTSRPFLAYKKLLCWVDSRSCSLLIVYSVQALDDSEYKALRLSVSFFSNDAFGILIAFPSRVE